MSSYFALIIIVVVTFLSVYFVRSIRSGDWRIFVSKKTLEREREEYFERWKNEHAFGIIPARTISFNDRFDLTRAAVTGRKTSTRIVISCDPTQDYERNKVPLYELSVSYPVVMSYEEQMRFNNACCVAMMNETDRSCLKDGYRSEFDGKGWTDKDYVKPSLMLFRVVVSGRKVCHLRDITDAEILKEGVKDYGNGKFGFFDGEKEYFANRVFDSPREAYAAMVNEIEGKDIWALNPWVLALEFEPDKGNFRYVKAYGDMEEADEKG